MNPQNDYKSVLTEVIKKQMIVLGPDITLSKVREVTGITVLDDGTVTDVVGDEKAMTQQLLDSFTQLAGGVVQKTMEPLMAYTEVLPDTTQPATSSTNPTTPPLSIKPDAQEMPLTPTASPIQSGQAEPTPPATQPEAPAVPTSMSTEPQPQPTPEAHEPMAQEAGQPLAETTAEATPMPTPETPAPVEPQKAIDEATAPKS